MLECCQSDLSLSLSFAEKWQQYYPLPSSKTSTVSAFCLPPSPTQSFTSRNVSFTLLQELAHTCPALSCPHGMQELHWRVRGFTAPCSAQNGTSPDICRVFSSLLLLCLCLICKCLEGRGYIYFTSHKGLIYIC